MAWIVPKTERAVLFETLPAIVIAEEYDRRNCTDLETIPEAVILPVRDISAPVEAERAPVPATLPCTALEEALKGLPEPVTPPASPRLVILFTIPAPVMEPDTVFPKEMLRVTIPEPVSEPAMFWKYSVPLAELGRNIRLVGDWKMCQGFSKNSFCSATDHGRY